MELNTKTISIAWSAGLMRREGAERRPGLRRERGAVDPYRAPLRREGVAGTSRRVRLWLLWVILLAPYLVLLLNIPTLRLLLALFPVMGRSA
jgi:hypothetical protein